MLEVFNSLKQWFSNLRTAQSENFIPVFVCSVQRSHFNFVIRRGVVFSIAIASESDIRSFWNEAGKANFGRENNQSTGVCAGVGLGWGRPGFWLKVAVFWLAISNKLLLPDAFCNLHHTNLVGRPNQAKSLEQTQCNSITRLHERENKILDLMQFGLQLFSRESCFANQRTKLGIRRERQR